MKHTITPNGHLVIELETADDRENVEGWERGHWEELFGDNGLGLIGNGWTPVAPEWIGALTDAPIVTDDFDLSDDGTYTVRGDVWWFPNYCVEDPIETLLETGRVVFTRAPE